ncbi:hypothetical protein PACTADRAFT_24433, partial [Pachysolen tannophilus NRRL Y-2460]
QEVDGVVHAISGATGGALSMLLTYPLVTLSTRAQTRYNQEKYGLVLWLESVKSYLKKQGLTGLYSGLESALIGITINNFVYYYFYEYLTRFYLLKNKKNGDRKYLTVLQSMVSGAIAGSLTVISTNPIWVANTRMSVTRKTQNFNTLNTIIKIIKKDGIKSLFNGVLPALILVANPIIQYTIFEQCKNILLKARSSNKLRPIDAFFLGALGKLCATSITYPYITLKARMHLLGHDESDDLNEENIKIKNNQRKSMFELIKSIFMNEGFKGFYGGISVKLTQSILTAAFLFLFKEELVNLSIKLVKASKSFKK